jgi:hypothetical protein
MRPYAFDPGTAPESEIDARRAFLLLAISLLKNILDVKCTCVDDSGFSLWAT